MKKVLKMLMIITILICIIVLVKFVWARYMTKIEGDSVAPIAKFAFDVNTNTEVNMEIDLAETRAEFEQYAEVNENTIGPGTSGGFEIEIDATNSDVSLEYDVQIDVNNDNNTRFPKNLIFYSDSEMKNAIYHENDIISLNGVITANDNQKVKKLYIYWKWDFETGQTQSAINENDLYDVYWIEKSITIPIKVVGKQINENLIENQYNVSFNANGGTINGYGNSEMVTKKINEQYGQLPSASQEPYTFKGWAGSNLLDYNEITNAAANFGISADDNGYIRDSTPTDDNRLWIYDLANWKTVVSPGIYTLTLEFSKQCTNNEGNNGMGWSNIRAMYPDDEPIFISFNGVFLNVDRKSFSFNVSKTSNIGIMVKAFDGVYRIKLEKNDIATDWEPYRLIKPEDYRVVNNDHILTAMWSNE